MSDFIENKLKAISAKELESIIARAISEATGDEFEATVSAIDYESETWPKASFKVRVSKPLRFGETT